MPVSKRLLVIKIVWEDGHIFFFVVGYYDINSQYINKGYMQAKTNTKQKTETIKKDK